MKFKDKLDRLTQHFPVPGAPSRSAARGDVDGQLDAHGDQPLATDVEDAVLRAAVLAHEEVALHGEPAVLMSPARAAVLETSAGRVELGGDSPLGGGTLERASAISRLRERLDAMRSVGKGAGASAGSHARASTSPSTSTRALTSTRADVAGSTLGAGGLGLFGRRVGAPDMARVPPRPVELPGEVIETPEGKLCRVVVTHDEDHRHGSALVSLAREVCPREVSLLALDPTLEDIDYAGALYIDTETTGLAGGAGTLPFLVGMAWFEGERLVVEQLLLPRPGLEGPMLARLAERLSLASVVVSFNGKSFDWPLLRTRFILNRVAAPSLPAHLDLLHCARRVYKARLGSVRLIHLEQALMGFERVDDIAGELIPERYLAFLRGAPGSTLVPIIDHNRSDLVALPALLGDIVRRFVADAESSPLLPPKHAHDELGFARVAARGASSERAIVLAHRAVEADVRGELTATALFLVGELKLRRGDLEGACEAFEGSVATSVSSLDSARAHLALAKLHEHKTKQRERARHHAALTVAFEGEEASARRVARLAKATQRAEAARARGEGRRARSQRLPAGAEKRERNTANT